MQVRELLQSIHVYPVGRHGGRFGRDRSRLDGLSGAMLGCRLLACCPAAWFVY